MEFAICTVAAAPVRKEPSHRTEMVNQLLFGETMQVMETKDEWLKVRTIHDDYEGWLTDHLVSEIDEQTATSAQPYVATSLLNAVTTSNQLINLPMGSFLVGFEEETRLLWLENYKYHGTYRNTDRPFDKDLLLKTIHAWINAPYLWGGKTFMGVDCSGFVQTAFKVLGIALFRDAYQQAEQGDTVERLSQAEQGDLAFFNNENGKIIHVGILLNDREIIHASGKVRIDKIDREGITNRETGKRTHGLHSIKRVF